MPKQVVVKRKVPTTTNALILSRDEHFYFLSTSVRVLCYQPPYHPQIFGRHYLNSSPNAIKKKGKGKGVP
jgi:hypothetical protein